MGTTKLCTVYEDQLFQNLNVYTNEYLTQLVNVMNMNTSYVGVTALAASASANYFIPLIGCPYEGLFIGGVKSDIRIKVNFAKAVETSMGTLAVNSIKLVIDEISLPKAERDRLMHEYENSIIENHYFDYLRMQSQPTVTASQLSTFKLSFFIAKLRGLPLISVQIS